METVTTTGVEVTTTGVGVTTTGVEVSDTCSECYYSSAARSTQQCTDNSCVNTATISREITPTALKTVTVTMGQIRPTVVSSLATSVETRKDSCSKCYYSSMSSSVVIGQGKDNNQSSILLIAILISIGCIILLLVVVTIILGAVVYRKKRTTGKLRINNKNKTEDVKMDTIVENESTPPIYAIPFSESLQQQVCS